MSKERNIIILARAAKQRKLVGVGAYEIGVAGESNYLKLFLDTFSNELKMEYPCSDYSGTRLRDGEEGIKLKALLDHNGKAVSTSDYDIIDYVHKTLNERVWSIGTCIALGRR